MIGGISNRDAFNAAMFEGIPNKGAVKQFGEGSPTRGTGKRRWNMMQKRGAPLA